MFPDLFPRALTATFDQVHASADGGAVLLKAADRRLGVTDAIATCLTDRRTPAKVAHRLPALVGQRVFGIACGYPDANDGDRLADDPIQKLLLDRDPITGRALASQPTISRFENGVGRAALYRAGCELAAAVVVRHQRRLRGRARVITIDLDPTDDPTHGAQQLSFFNGHYDTWCYLPVLAFLTFNDEAEQYLCAAVLRPGNVPASCGAVGLLTRLLTLVRISFPRTRVLVRLDGGFATPEILAWLDAAPRVDYVVAMGRNAVLARLADAAMEAVRAQSEASGETAHVYLEARYAAHTWPHERRVVIKAEVVRLPGRSPKDNARFVITNRRPSPRFVYERVYCARGDIENRIKELHNDLAIGRTSCTRFWANQLRVLLTAGAYILLQELRLHAKRTRWARAQVATLRLRLLKLGVHVAASVRRIVLHLPRAAADRAAWCHIACRLGARPG
ncbi:MAG: IS1380 family transposase [Vicinamibacterales bacterium]